MRSLTALLPPPLRSVTMKLSETMAEESLTKIFCALESFGVLQQSDSRWQQPTCYSLTR